MLHNKNIKQIIEMEDSVLWQELIKEFPEAIVYDNFIFLPNENPIALVAHIDTVRTAMDKPVVVQQNNLIKNINGILGADDRAGVYALLQLYKKCKKKNIPLPSLLFTDGEESGGIGAKEFCSQITLKQLENIHLFVEFDRCGVNEFIDYVGNAPEEVLNYFTKEGYVQEIGTYSDVYDIAATFGIPTINVSIGYYQQHSRTEYLVIDEMFLNINRVFRMLKNPIEKRYELLPEVFDYNTYNGYGYGVFSKKQYDKKEASEYDIKMLLDKIKMENEFLPEHCPNCSDTDILCDCRVLLKLYLQHANTEDGYMLLQFLELDEYTWEYCEYGDACLTVVESNMTINEKIEVIQTYYSISDTCYLCGERPEHCNCGEYIEHLEHELPAYVAEPLIADIMDAQEKYQNKQEII